MENPEKNKTVSFSYLPISLMFGFLLIAFTLQFITPVFDFEYEDSIIVIIIQIFTLFSFLYAIYYLHKFLANFTDNNYPISPLAAVLLNLIPFFNLYWAFKWTNEISTFIDSKNKQTKMPMWLGGITIIFALFIAILVNREQPASGSIFASLILLLLMGYIYKAVQKVLDVEIKQGKNLKELSFVSGGAIILLIGIFISSLIQESISTANFYKETGFFYFIKSKDIEAVKKVFEYGADINQKNEEGKTPLIFALENEEEEIADFLISSGADVNAYSEVIIYATNDKSGPSRTVKVIPIGLAISKGYFEIAQSLISKGAVLEVEDEDGAILLQVACYGGSLDIVKYLINQGADIQFRNEYLGNPLFISCSEKHLDITEFLISKGADINSTNYGGETCLIIAVRQKNTKMVELLLAHGADASIKDNNGNTPMQIILSSSDEIGNNNREEILKLLQKKEAEGLKYQ